MATSAAAIVVILMCPMLLVAVNQRTSHTRRRDYSGCRRKIENLPFAHLPCLLMGRQRQLVLRLLQWAATTGDADEYR